MHTITTTTPLSASQSAPQSALNQDAFACSRSTSKLDNHPDAEKRPRGASKVIRGTVRFEFQVPARMEQWSRGSLSIEGDAGSAGGDGAFVGGAAGTRTLS